jgi:hypothetical protein
MDGAGKRSVAGTSAAGTSKSAAGKSVAGKSKAGKITDLPTQGNLLGKGAAAAARYINTFGTIKHYDDMDEFD